MCILVHVRFWIALLNFLFSGPVIYNLLSFSIGNFLCGPLVTVSCQVVCLCLHFGYEMKCNSCTSVMVLLCGIFYSTQCFADHWILWHFWTLEHITSIVVLIVFLMPHMLFTGLNILCHCLLTLSRYTAYVHSMSLNFI